VRRVFEIGAFHVLCEIELSFALASPVDIHRETEEETFSLLVPETDPRAIGCTRTGGRVCSGAHDSPCAYRAMREQLQWLCENLPEDLSQLPRFPDCHVSCHY